VEQITGFRVPKTTGTYADVLRAVGLATIVSEIGEGEGSVSIADAGHEYVIRGTHEISGSENLAISVGYPYLAYEAAQPAPIGISPEPYPYKAEKLKEERRKKYFQAEKKKTGPRRRKRKTGEELAAEPPPPDRRHSLAKAINSIRSGSDSWNELARAIHERIAGKDKQAFLQGIVTHLQHFPLRRPAADDLPTSILQSFLPIAGKGTNRPKPDGAKLDNLKEPWLDWFEEWCRYRGVWYALNARFTGQKQKDVKFAALLPGTQVTLAAMRTIADQFVREDWIASGQALFTNVKSDVFALLGLARWLVAHSEFAPVPENRLYKFLKTRQAGQPRPRDVIAGISSAYFKSLGTGRALADTSNLLLPDWFPITSATYESWLAVLDEHRNVLSYLDERKSEEASLLVKYRDALSTNDVREYLEFFAAFGAQLMRRRERDPHTEQFTRSNLEVLVMGLSSELNPSIAMLIKDAAFLALADAVHEATVKAQYWKGRNQQEYEVHYGLAHEWKRAADRGLELIQVISDFVRAYNEENAKRKEKSKPSRDDIARADLDRVLDYLTSGKVDPRTLCLLLLAYGFSMTDDERDRAQEAREKKQVGQTTAPSATLN